MTSGVRATLESRWREAGEPSEGWVFPARTKSEHIEPSTVRKKHKRAITESEVTPFVLYSLRHTFLTRLGEAGCDVWTLARIAGHSKISMSERYVHPSDDAVQRAFGRLNADGPARLPPPVVEQGG
jgi:integrase